MGVSRLGHVTLRVKDLELAAAYYTEVVGLQQMTDTRDEVCLKAWDEPDHHSLSLVPAATPGIERLGLKLGEASDLDELERRCRANGHVSERIGDGQQPGLGETLRVTAPSGHCIELYRDTKRVGRSVPNVNPPPKPRGLPGLAPPQLHHVALCAHDVPAASAFFRDVLNFRLTEQILGAGGRARIVYLERTGHALDLAIFEGDDGGLHHVGLLAETAGELFPAADTLRADGIAIEAGPLRHGATRMHALYFADPSGNRNALCSGGYRVDPDADPVTWTEDQLGAALFYHAGAVGTSFLAGVR